MTEIKGQLEPWEIVEILRREKEDPTEPLTNDEIYLCMQIYLNDYKEHLLKAN